MDRSISIQWTATARHQLAQLPPKVRRGLLNKAGELKTCADPRTAHKPLVGPLEGYYRITYARYRAVYRVDEERLASGGVIVRIRVLFVAAGKRKERDRSDIYRIAEKIVNLGIISFEPPEEVSESDETE